MNLRSGGGSSAAWIRVVSGTLLLLIFLAATFYVWGANEIRGQSLSPLSGWLHPSYVIAVAGLFALWVGIIWRKRRLSWGGATFAAAMFGFWFADDALHKEGLAAQEDEYAGALVARALNHSEESYPCRGGWRLALVRYPPNNRDYHDLRWQLLPPEDIAHRPVDIMVRNYQGELIPTSTSRRFGYVKIDVEDMLETCAAQPEVRD